MIIDAQQKAITLTVESPPLMVWGALATFVRLRGKIPSTPIIKSKFRKMDMVARWGGEEFIVLTSATTFEASRFMAERVKLAIEQEIIAVERLVHEDQRDLDTEEEMMNITVSVGFTNITPDDSFSDAFKRAEDLLYTAKQEGRTKVRCICRHLTE